MTSIVNFTDTPTPAGTDYLVGYRPGTPNDDIKVPVGSLMASDGSIPLTADWDAGAFKIITKEVETRNSSTATQILINKLFIDPLNYERLKITGNSVAVESAGTGAANIDLLLLPAGSGKIGIGTSTPSWNVEVSGAGAVIHQLVSTDNVAVQYRLKSNSTLTRRLVGVDNIDVVQSQILLKNSEVDIAGTSNFNDLFATFNATATTLTGGIVVGASVTLKLNTSAANTDTSTMASFVIGITDTSVARTVTLQTADTVAGREYIIKDQSGAAATNNITIATQAAQTIDGASTLVISANYGVAKVYCDGTNWFSF